MKGAIYSFILLFGISYSMCNGKNILLCIAMSLLLALPTMFNIDGSYDEKSKWEGGKWLYLVISIVIMLGICGYENSKPDKNNSSDIEYSSWDPE